MDRLIAEKETKEETLQEKTEQVEEVKENVQEEVSASPTNEYVSSFEGQTIADIKREEEKKSAQKFEKEKEVLIEKQFEKVEKTEKVEQETQKVEEKESEKPVNIIEKPNYDLIEQPKRVLKLKKAKPEKTQRKKRKLAGILLACTLGASAIVCIVNSNVIENMNSNLFQIEEGYKLRLDKYLRDIAKLDGTKKSMEFLDTYPDKQLSAGDQGEKSNWFDRLCNFIAGLFGG